MLTYGAIITSVLSLSSTAVDILFMKKHKDGKLEINLGRHTTVKENDAKSYGVAVLLLSILIVCPKIVFYSWTFAVFRWRAFAFFAIMFLLVTLAKIQKKSDSGKRVKVSNQYIKRVKSSIPSTFIGIFSVETNPLTSGLMLSSSAVFAAFVLIFAIPHHQDDRHISEQIFPEHSTFFQTDPSDMQATCICRDMNSDLDSWQYAYFKDGIVCQKLTNKLAVTTSNTTARCYDKIFFQPTFAFDIISLHNFPAIYTCITYHGITRYLTRLDANLLRSNLVKRVKFDETCQVDVTEMFVPCSRKVLVEIKVLLSIMIVWMGCSLAILLLSPKIVNVKNMMGEYLRSVLIITLMLSSIALNIYY